MVIIIVDNYDFNYLKKLKTLINNYDFNLKSKIILINYDFNFKIKSHTHQLPF